jgi:hypothetical protein
LKDLATGLAGGALTFFAAFLWSETQAFKRLTDGAPQGLTTGHVFSLQQIQNHAIETEFKTESPATETGEFELLIQEVQRLSKLQYWKDEEVLARTKEELDAFYLTKMRQFHKSTGFNAYDFKIMQDEYLFILGIRGFLN